MGIQDVEVKLPNSTIVRDGKCVRKVVVPFSATYVLPCLEEVKYRGNDSWYDQRESIQNMAYPSRLRYKIKSKRGEPNLYYAFVDELKECVKNTYPKGHASKYFDVDETLKSLQDEKFVLVESSEFLLKNDFSVEDGRVSGYSEEGSVQYRSIVVWFEDTIEAVKDSLKEALSEELPKVRYPLATNGEELFDFGFNLVHFALVSMLDYEVLSTLLQLSNSEETEFEVLTRSLDDEFRNNRSEKFFKRIASIRLQRSKYLGTPKKKPLTVNAVVAELQERFTEESVCKSLDYLHASNYISIQTDEDHTVELKEELTRWILRQYERRLMFLTEGIRTVPVSLRGIRILVKHYKKMFETRKEEFDKITDKIPLKMKAYKTEKDGTRVLEICFDGKAKNFGLRRVSCLRKAFKAVEERIKYSCMLVHLPQTGNTLIRCVYRDTDIATSRIVENLPAVLEGLVKVLLGRARYSLGIRGVEDAEYGDRNAISESLEQMKTSLETYKIPIEMKFTWGVEYVEALVED